MQEMVCSSCHPFVGTWQMRTVCPQLCDQWCVFVTEIHGVVGEAEELIALLWAGSMHATRSFTARMALGR